MATASPGDGLLRWLLGGLLAGGVVLGLIVGAYAIFDHGDGNAGVAVGPKTTAAETGTNASSGGGSVARGKQLFADNGCGGCHSTDGSASVGPTIKGLAGSRVQLADGSTATVDDGYLAKAIASPDRPDRPGLPARRHVGGDLELRPGRQAAGRLGPGRVHQEPALTDSPTRGVR